MSTARRMVQGAATAGLLLLLAGCSHSKQPTRSSGRTKPPPPDIPAPMATPDGPGVGVPERPVVMKPFDFARPAFGENLQFRVYAPNEESARRAVDAAFDRVKQTEQTTEADIQRVVAANGKPSVPVGRDLLRIFRKIQNVQVFAGTVEGFPKVIDVDMKQSTVTADSASPDTLRRLARAFSADAGVAAIKEAGFASSAVHFGEGFVAGDAPPGRDGWPAAIEGKEKPSSLEHAAVARIGQGPTITAPNALTALLIAQTADKLERLEAAKLIEAYDGVNIFYPNPSTRPDRTTQPAAR